MSEKPALGFPLFLAVLVAMGEKGPQASLMPMLHIVQMWPLSSGHAAGPDPEAIPDMVFERGWQSLQKFYWIFFLADIQRGTFLCLGYKEVKISLTVMTDCRSSKRASCQM